VSNQYGRSFEPHPKSPILTGRAQSGKLTTGDSNKPVSAQAQFGVSTYFTVTIDSNIVTDPSGPVAFTKAVVEWTNDGITIVREIDVAAGASISGLAEAVAVRVYDYTATAPTVEAHTYALGVDYGVSISITSRQRPTTAAPPVRTGLAATPVNQSAAQEVDVPLGANSVLVYGALAAAAASVLVTFLTADGATTLLKTVAGDDPIPLIAGVGVVRVTNLSASQADITVVFGIDG
jgi:hypothetical protein